MIQYIVVVSSKNDESYDWKLGRKYCKFEKHWARPKKVPRFNQTFPQAELPRFEQAESEAAYRAAEIPEQFQARRL
ncbi:hypothetical protein TNCV_1263471 [Trichonephila clavipes]|nr:hypothetical protein TNCV_1263471 [Trichonephila clavipes]